MLIHFNPIISLCSNNNQYLMILQIIIKNSSNNVKRNKININKITNQCIIIHKEQVFKAYFDNLYFIISYFV